MGDADLDPSAARLGSTLRDKWVLEELLGVGGMASVYRARHKIGRLDAIKILHPKVARSESLRSRFEQEAHAVNAFRHPGVVEIRDVDTADDGTPFLVMELLEGESLARSLNRGRSLDPTEVLVIAAQVLDVLAAAHSRAIIHRDIKPDNLFLHLPDDTSTHGIQPWPRVKVLDFGIARVRSADKRALTTKAGVTLGTMAYMAPEQARGEEIDGRADLYALGATMFRILAGRVVHEADSQASLVMRVIAFGAPRLATIAPGIDPRAALVIDRALAFDPDDRYPDATTMLGDVRAVLAHREPPWASQAPPLVDRPRISSFDGDASQAPPTVTSPVHRGAPITAVGFQDVPPAESIDGPARLPVSARSEGVRTPLMGGAPTYLGEAPATEREIIGRGPTKPSKQVPDGVVAPGARTERVVSLAPSSLASGTPTAVGHAPAPPVVVVPTGPARRRQGRSVPTWMIGVTLASALLALGLVAFTIVSLFGAPTRGRKNPRHDPSSFEAGPGTKGHGKRR